MDCSGRIERLCKQSGTDHLFVSRIEDIRWLTGFTGGTAQCVVDRVAERAFLCVDARYHSRAVAEVQQSGASVEVVLVQSIDDIYTTMKDLDVGVVGVHPQHVTAAQMRQLESVFHVVDADDSLDQLRRVKSNEEIALMERAAQIADRALAAVVGDGLVGKTEKHIRDRLEYLMRSFGADRASFSTIVATGVHGASPHHEPTDAVIEDGHGVVIDMGAEVGGYRSDMTRTILVGRVCDEYREMFETVRQAQREAVETVRAGINGADVDAAARRVFAVAGCEDEFVHGVGHGIGLYIHEVPILSARCTAVLQASEVVTVEPGLYRGGVGGVRIEDQVVVTDTGCRILTLSPKELSCPQSPQMI